MEKLHQRDPVREEQDLQHGCREAFSYFIIHDGSPDLDLKVSCSGEDDTTADRTDYGGDEVRLFMVCSTWMIQPVVELRRGVFWTSSLRCGCVNVSVPASGGSESPRGKLQY